MMVIAYRMDAKQNAPAINNMKYKFKTEALLGPNAPLRIPQFPLSRPLLSSGRSHGLQHRIPSPVAFL